MNIPPPRILAVVAVVASSGGCHCWADEGQMKPSPFAVDPHAPVHGALVAVPGGSGTKFVQHQAHDVAAAGSTLVVGATTGVWTVDPATLARKDRVAPPPVLAMATSPDGKLLAYAVGDSHDKPARAVLDVVSFPDGAPVANVDVDAPVRLRFSDDGKRIAIASAVAETASLFDIASRKLSVFRAKEQVNDAVPVDAAIVAYADNGDEAVLGDVGRDVAKVRTAPLMRAMRETIKGTSRDQNSVAFDAATGVLVFGGDDNRVWRLAGAMGPSPSLLPMVEELDGNVVDLGLLHAHASGATAPSIVAASDQAQLVVVAPDGSRKAKLDPVFNSTTSVDVRIAVLPDDDVLVAMNGALGKWKPATGEAIVSHDFPMRLAYEHDGPRDTIFLLPIEGKLPRRHVLQRVERGAPVADVAATVLGELEMQGTPEVVSFPSGSHAIHGSTMSRTYRVVYVTAGAVEPPIDLPIKDAITAERPDHASFVVYDRDTGVLLELDGADHRGKRIGKAASNPASARPDWDAASGAWRLRANDNADVPIVPP